MTDRRDDAHSGLTLFARQLQAARAKAGMTRDDLAASINFSPSLVSMIESRRRVPSMAFAQGCDKALNMPGTFVLLQPGAAMPLPAWFQAYADAEGVAVQLRSWQPMVIDGLLQTEGYARALLATRPNTTEDELDTLVAARMERQAILSRDSPPVVWVVLDEAVLMRQAGGSKVMREQLMQLGDLAARPHVTIGIVPLARGVHAGVSGAFAVAETEDGARVGYLDTANEGYVVEDRSGVNCLALTFDTLLAEALPRGASREMIMKWADRYDGSDEGHLA